MLAQLFALLKDDGTCSLESGMFSQRRKARQGKDIKVSIY